jgi:hypothetical protein
VLAIMAGLLGTAASLLAIQVSGDHNPASDLFSLIGFGPVFAISAFLLYLVQNRTQELPSAGWRDIFSFGTVLLGVAMWLLLGPLFWLISTVIGLHSPIWTFFTGSAGSGILAMLLAGRARELLVGNYLAGQRFVDGFRRLEARFNPVAVVDTRSVSPRQAWRHHTRLVLLLAPLAGLATTLLTEPSYLVRYGIAQGMAGGAGQFVLGTMLAGPVSNRGIATMLTAAQLAATERTPLRLMAFLEDARRRNLLRAAGPVYQFRHARLQERLAQQANSPTTKPR